MTPASEEKNHGRPRSDPHSEATHLVFKRRNPSRYVPSVSPALPLRICAIVGVIVTRCPLSPLQGSLALQHVNFPTSTPPNGQPEDNFAYLSTPTHWPSDSTPTQRTSTDFSPAPLHANELGPIPDVEMRHSFVGPLSVETFFDDFLPLENVPPPSMSPGFTDMAGATSEKQMYRFFVRSFDPLAFSSSFSYNEPPRSVQ